MDYTITLVDNFSKPMPSARKLVKAGVPVSVAMKWNAVRKTTNPSGLRKQLKDRRN